MTGLEEAEDPRRRWLIQGLTAGIFCSTLSAGGAFAQSLLGSKPGPLPAGRSIYRLSGRVTVNGKNATLDTFINPTDTIETGPNSEIVFVVGGNAMILRSDSRLDLAGEKKENGSLIISGLRLLTGKLLSVSRNQPTTLKTPTAVIGIRGTGWYMEAEPELTYFCTCYGVTDIASSADPSSKETVAASHHDKPVYITAGGPTGQNIRPAGFKNHSDQELMLIETLVGRTTPFNFPGNSYEGPRRSY
ncbi:FecR family protein [Paucimonas lemoignei]|uniref:FecR family protein n=1 Tax=Paucimonas lemoignei TaxID=29443 RepID=A0A4R3HZ57_PAULE|nr:FecR domain-containing protein [Paucimonas lemoignei]TCS37973.1 FecR family protein [Paucimonas lemoignei]